MNVLKRTHVGHAYLGRTVLDRTDLSVSAGEVVAIVGPSSCGKSTLAHIAAGLVEARGGRVSRRYRRHAMIFQDPALMPWADARANIALPLKLARIARAERKARIAQVAGQVALTTDDLE